MLWKWLLGFIFFFVFALAGAAEIALKSGEAVSGEVVQEGSESITLLLKDGIKKQLSRSEIASIDYTGGKFFKREYLVTGLTLGAPAAINLAGGYYWKDYGFRVSGAYWGSFWGVQTDLAWKLIEDKDFLADLSALAGHVEANFNWSGGSVPRVSYAGLGLSVNWLGFTGEIGPAISDIPGVICIWQIGYLHRFN